MFGKRFSLMAIAVFVGGSLLLSSTNLSANPLVPKQKPKEMLCLAKNIFFEARNQPYDEMVKIANVTMNRVGHKSFPDSVCGVVYEPAQFSWTGTKKYVSNYLTNDMEIRAWKLSLEIANDAVHGNLEDQTKKALYFHSKSIKDPYWTKKFQKTLVTPENKFYTADGR